MPVRVRAASTSAATATRATGLTELPGAGRRRGVLRFRAFGALLRAGHLAAAPRCWHGRPAAGISYFLAARARTSWPRGHGWVATRLLRRCRSTWRAVGGLAWGVGAWCAPGGRPGLWFWGRRLMMTVISITPGAGWVATTRRSLRALTRCQQRAHPLDSGFGPLGGPGGSADGVAGYRPASRRGPGRTGWRKPGARRCLAGRRGGVRCWGRGLAGEWHGVGWWGRVRLGRCSRWRAGGGLAGPPAGGGGECG